MTSFAYDSQVTDRSKGKGKVGVGSSKRAPPLIDRGVKLIKILQKCNTVLTFPSCSSLSLTLSSLYPSTSIAPFFFPSRCHCLCNELFAACQRNATTYGSHWLAESHNAASLVNLIIEGPAQVSL